MIDRTRLLGAAFILATVLSACASQPVYRPRGPNDTIGYTDEKIGANRYRVTFSGAVATKRAEVEDYLLRRAAEVTLASGKTHFVFDTRDTEKKTYYHTTFGGYDRWPWYGYRNAWYWSSWDYPPRWGYFDDDVIPVTRYTAYAEIVTLSDDEAAREPRSLSAQEVLARVTAPPPQGS